MTDPDPLIGKQLANFRVERVLGRGGMATVYYGWDVQLERPVAVKVIAQNYQDDPDYAARFINEARAIAAWHHPNILQVYTANDQGGSYYYVMEYVAGRDLGAVLAETRRAGRRLPVREVVRIGRAVAQALDYAHKHGIIHRDVKPANVIVADDGRVMLADFGLAMDVARGTLGRVFGSPHYFSPEQARSSADVVAQSDLYSLGIMLYEMLTGQVPFDDPSPVSLAMQQIERQPPPPRSINPALSPAAEGVLLRALAKHPSERFQTGRELMAALEPTLDDDRPTRPPDVAAPAAPQPAAEAGRSPVGVRTRGRRPGAWLAIVGAAVGVLALALAFWWLGARFAGGQSAVPTATANTAAPTAAVTPDNGPAIVPGQGDHFAAYYDDTGFYLKNDSQTDRAINPVAFERVLGDGSFDNHFDGSYWGQIYPNIRAGQCMVLELIDYRDHLDPGACQNKDLVYRSPNASEAIIFWTAKEGSTQFRVLWDNTEVGRCDIAAKACDIYLP